RKSNGEYSSTNRSQAAVSAGLRKRSRRLTGVESMAHLYGMKWHNSIPRFVNDIGFLVPVFRFLLSSQAPIARSTSGDVQAAEEVRIVRIGRIKHGQGGRSRQIETLGDCTAARAGSRLQYIRAAGHAHTAEETHIQGIKRLAYQHAKGARGR